MNAKDIQRFLAKYGLLIQYILHMQNGSIHAKVMDDVNDFLSEGQIERNAIRMALKRNRHVLDEMWDNESDMETDEGLESEEEERQDDDNDDSDEA